MWGTRIAVNWSRVVDNTSWVYTAALIVVVAAVAARVRWVRRGKPPIVPYVLAAVSVAWLAVVAVVTLSPVAGGGQAVR